MSKPHLAAAVAVVLFLRWLAVGHVTMTVAGATAVVPALALVTACVIAAAAAVVALVVYRARAEHAIAAAWQQRKAATP